MIDQTRPGSAAGGELAEAATATSRRANPRVSAQSTPELVARFDGQELKLPLSNLSYGGAFFNYRSKSPLPVGAELELELQQSDGAAAVSTRARIVHSGREGFAVSFIKMPFQFSAALSRLLTRQIMNATNRAGEHETPGRVALLLQQGPDHEVLFTTTLGKNGVWVLTEILWAYTETLWVTLLEHGMFDCEARVLWCDEDAMALEFIDPSEEFSQAYQRILDTFLG